jgi:hypothetical protein
MPQKPKKMKWTDARRRLADKERADFEQQLRRLDTETLRRRLIGWGDPEARCYGREALVRELMSLEGDWDSVCDDMTPEEVAEAYRKAFGGPPLQITNYTLYHPDGTMTYSDE